MNDGPWRWAANAAEAIRSRNHATIDPSGHRVGDVPFPLADTFAVALSSIVGQPW